jgi:hypothetical protein
MNELVSISLNSLSHVRVIHTRVKLPVLVSIVFKLVKIVPIFKSGIKFSNTFVEIMLQG